jgi:hypothetical protein
MFEIEKNVPIPRNRTGRRSKKREAMVATMKEMAVGDSFRVEYQIASMRNFLRNSGVEGIFRTAQDSGNFVRVWRVS